MVHVQCRCGSEFDLPDGMVGEPSECPDCKASVRLISAGAPVSIGMPGRLLIRKGPQRVGEQLVLLGEGPIEVGKLREKPISLLGNMVSRNHCRFARGPDGWKVEDLNSTNGLYVNGARTKGKSLQRGDVVRVGEYELEYLLGPEQVDRPAPQPAAAAEDDDPLYQLAELEKTADTFEVPKPQPAAPPPIVGGIPCPSCGKTLPKNAKICVDCGIDVKTGKSILIRQGIDEDHLYANAETAIRTISWLIPFGLYPIASEGFGTRKPYVIWATALVTILASVLFFVGRVSNNEDPSWGRDLLLWAGRQPTEKDILRGYIRQGGDMTALEEKETQLKGKVPADKLVVTAYQQLPPEEQCYGEFHWYQLFTHALLHGGLMHLAGNMLFLLVFGTRVNALIGPLKTGIIYPVLAAAAATAYMLGESGHAPMAMLGASGAIMGLAGMYFILFPVHRVYMAIWLRLGLFTGYRARWKVWAVRGFWVVLFYIAFDVLATVLGSKDGVAHWAHLGGFMAGTVIALGLLLARQIDAHGGDLLSVMLGRRAWAILGRPGQRAAAVAVA